MKPVSFAIVLLSTALGLTSPQTTGAYDRPVRHWVSYPYQVSPPPGRYIVNPPPSGPATDRYATPPTGYPGGVAPPPNVLNRAQEAASEAGVALRGAGESGVQQANQPFSRAGNQALESSRSVGQGISEQVQDFGRSTVRQFEYTGDNLRNVAEQTLVTAGAGVRQVGDAVGVTAPPLPPAAVATAPAVNGFAPPPWTHPSATSTAPLWSPDSNEPAAGRNVPAIPAASSSGPPAISNSSAPVETAPRSGTARNATGWTGLNESATPPPTAPPLAVPSMSANSTINPTQAARPEGAAAPAAAGTVGPAAPHLPTISRNPLPPVATDAYGSAPPAANRANAASASAAEADPFSRPPVLGGPDGLPAGTAVSAPLPSVDSGPTRVGLEAPPKNGGSEWPFTMAPLPAPSAPAGPDRGAPVNSQPASGAMESNYAAPALGRAPAATILGAKPDATSANPPTEAPWMPLIVVSLSLVGSLSANLFLGWSYVDARHRYSVLVRKTANKFRRAAEAA